VTVGLTALAACIATALAASGYALANAVGITFTAAGPQPSVVSVTLGDTVTFTNNDTVPRVIASKKLGWTAPAVAPGGTFTYVVTKAGTWGYSIVDTAGKNRISGTLKVAKAGPLTLTATALPILYGHSIVLRGKTSLPTVPVAIEFKSPGDQGWDSLDTPVTPLPDGTFAVTVTPKLETQYRANVLDGQLISTASVVKVEPRLTFRPSTRRMATGKLMHATIHVVPTGSVKRVAVQAYDLVRKHWHIIAQANVTSTGNAKLTFAARPGRVLLRGATMSLTLTKGFAPASTKPIAVVGVGSGKHPHPGKKKH
jgi:plastocyanin